LVARINLPDGHYTYFRYPGKQMMDQPLFQYALLIADHMLHSFSPKEVARLLNWIDDAGV